MTFFGWLRHAPVPGAVLAQRVLGLACPLCEAPAGAWCDPWAPATALTRPPCGLCGDPARCPDWCDAAAGYALVDPEPDPPLVLHDARILAAVRAGIIRPADAAARFAPGEAPPSLAFADQEASS